MSNRHTKSRLVLVFAILLTCLTIAVINQPFAIAQGSDPLYPCGTQMRRVSVGLSGEQTTGDHGEQYVSLSADGRYVVFDSGSPLVADDTNNVYDVFVYDCVTNELKRVSVSSSGEQANGISAGKDITPDGRYVIMYSSASNLVPNDTNGISDLFVHDRQIGETRRIPEGAASIPTRQSINSDGSLIAFDSSAATLVSGDTNNTSDIFIYHTATGTIELVSKNASGEQGNGASSEPSLSSDGRYLSFTSSATNLVANDNNGFSDIFRLDLITGQVQLVSVNAAGEQANQRSQFSQINADGSVVGFSSYASNLISGASGTWGNPYVRNMNSNSLLLLYVDPQGQPITSGYGSSLESISADGRYVVLSSGSSELVAGDTNGVTDVFVRDTMTGKTALVTKNALGEIGNDASGVATISDNGHYIGFLSKANNLVAGDTNLYFDSFIAPNPLFPPQTETSTPTTTSSPTASLTNTATGTPTQTATATNTPTATPTATNTPTASASPTRTATATSTVTALHPDTIGIFRPSTTTFYMRNSNTTGYADSTITFGASTYFPITGDWDGDGVDTPGVYQSSIGQFYLTNSTSNPAVLSNAFVLGIAGDQPIVGDWDGDGKDGVGVFRPSNGLIYLKNNLTTGFADFTMVLGIPGDVGIAGDWNGDGKDSPGVYRPSNQVFYLTNNICNCAVFADAQLGLGIASDKPFVGDWDGDGKSGVGVYRQSNGLTYIKNALTTGFADSSFVFGSANDYPLAGYWVRLPPPPPAPTFQPQ